MLPIFISKIFFWVSQPKKYVYINIKKAPHQPSLIDMEPLCPTNYIRYAKLYRIWTTYLLLIAACATANLAIGTRNDEQDTILSQPI